MLAFRKLPIRHFRSASPFIARRLLSATTSSTHASSIPSPDSLSEESEIRLMTRRFAETVISPLVSKMDVEARLDPTVLPSLFTSGLLGLSVPVSHGGSGLGLTAACIAVEELAKVDPSVALIVDVHSTLICTAIARFASEPLKKSLFPRLATSDLGAFSLSEAGSGSDAFALRARATQTGNGDFVLSGAKLWVSNAREAGIFVIFANVNFELGRKGITAFAVDAGTPGLNVGKCEDKLGMRASSCCEVVLEEVHVPKQNVIGAVGDGYKIAIQVLNEGRIAIGAQMIGLAQGTLDNTVPYLMERQQFNKRLFDNQGLRFQVAEMNAELQAARALVYQAARNAEHGEHIDAKEAACAKLFAAKTAANVARCCVEWMGGVGFTKDFPQEKFYRDVIVGKIYEGTHNIGLETIAKYLEREYAGW